MRNLVGLLPSAEFHIVAITGRSGDVTLRVSDWLRYTPDSDDVRISSVTDQISDDGFEYRRVAGISLNDLCSRRNFPEPYLVKIDVDGTEMDVLKGATSLINKESVFVVEATLADSEPRFARIVDFFRPFDFVLHDIIDPLWRPGDEALWQVDVIMVHEDSKFRQNKNYSPE